MNMLQRASRFLSARVFAKYCICLKFQNSEMDFHYEFWSSRNYFAKTVY